MHYGTKDDILKRFSSVDADEEGRTYLQFNASRYLRLLGRVAACRARLGPGPVRFLDVGPSYFTQMLCDRFPDDTVAALGIDHATSRGGHWPAALALDAVTFCNYDLRHAGDPSTWPALDPVQMIIFSEVLEHLYLAPSQVLACLRSLLAPGGYLLLTTPNAATLPKRLRFALLGKNPIPLFRENEENPGHFREYSQAELIAVGAACGLVPEEARIYNDAYAIELEKHNTLKGRLIRALSDIAPESMRENHYILYRNPG